MGIGGLGHMAVKFAAGYGRDVTAFTSSESKFAIASPKPFAYADAAELNFF